MAGSGDSNRAILFALGANLAIAGSKGVAAYFTRSSAMLAETVHSLADCGNQLLLLFGMKQAKRPASADSPLGYGKAIYFWSFLVAVMLFTVGGMFSLYEGIHKLQQPEPLRQWWWAVGVLVFGLVAEAMSMRACLQEVDKARGERSLDACLLPIESGMTAWPVVSVTPAQAQRLGQGQTLNGAFQPAGAVALFDEQGRALGLGEVDGNGCLRPQRLFAWVCAQPPKAAEPAAIAL